MTEHETIEKLFEERRSGSMDVCLTPSQEKTIERIYYLLANDRRSYRAACKEMGRDTCHFPEIKNVELEEGYRGTVYLTLWVGAHDDENSALLMCRKMRVVSISPRGKCLLLNAKKGLSKKRQTGVFSCCFEELDY